MKRVNKEPKPLTEEEKEQAIEFLTQWSKRPVVEASEDLLKNDVKAQAIWEKYTQVER